MKKIGLSSLLRSAAGLAPGRVAQADPPSVSVGSAQSRIEHFKDIRGVNLKYRY
ncbi:UNVERIFIED_CONTAM: hypothetical protein ODX46_17440, partial [Salmonella enterica subsp. enterica serovar Enteritidis]